MTMWVLLKAAGVLLLFWRSVAAEPRDLLKFSDSPDIPPWMDDAWASILRKLYDEVQSSVGFCLGADPDEIVRLVKLSYQWPPPTMGPDDSKDPVCANKTLTAMHLCGPEDIEVYLRFMQLTDDPEKIPGTRHCVAGMPKQACAPGFYDPVNSDFIHNQKVRGARKLELELENDSARPCCPGYFCPNGLTCMMPCPLGAYCPLAVAKLPPPPFQTPGSLALWCAPYAYRRRANLGCGGADRWAVIPQTAFPSTKWAAGSGNLYCPPGYYCPNTTHAIQCPRGRFCRQGTSSPERCPPGALCGPGTDVPINNYGGAAADAALLGVLAVLWWASTYKQNAQRIRDRVEQENGTLIISDWTTHRDGKTGLPLHTTSFIPGHSDSVPEIAIQPIDIKFKHISLRLRTSGHLVLSDVSASLRAARLTAVMGPSGSGKTSLLTALAGRASYAQMAGLVLVNGFPDRIQRYRRVTGFVPQDDVMHARLSVEENLLFAARLRLPAGTSAAEHKVAVDGVIEALELGSVRKQLVGDVGVRGISGGQRKRVNVGLELVGRPRLLFLDEPTSGLDAAGTRGLVEILRRIVRSSGVTAAVIVHQPRHEAFSLFDDLLLLGGAGRTVYYGPVDHVEAYFSGIGVDLPLHTNPADALLDAITSTPGRLCDAWQAHEMVNDGSGPEGLDPTAPPWSLLDGDGHGTQSVLTENLTARQRDNSLRRPAPGFVSQYLWCLQRAMLERSREPLQVFTDLAIIAAAGLTVGLLSDRGRATIMDYAAQMAYSVVAISLMAMVSAVGTFNNEMVLRREAASGLNRVSYFLAMDSFDFSGASLRSAIYLITWYSFSNPKAVLWQLYAVVLALFYACSGVGYALALALGAPSAQLGSAVLTLVSTLVARQPEGGTLLFLGQSLSASRWALEGLVIAESNQLTGVWLLARCADLAALHYDVRRYWGCLGALVLMGLMCRGLALGILMNRVK